MYSFGSFSEIEGQNSHKNVLQRESAIVIFKVTYTDSEHNETGPMYYIGYIVQGEALDSSSTCTSVLEDQSFLTKLLSIIWFV